MKKLFSFLLASFLFLPSVLAANLVSDESSDFDLDRVEDYPSVEIESEVDGDINAEHGISLLLFENEEILWEFSDIQVSGTAVDNGRVSSSVKAEYKANHKALYIPVLEDFVAGEILVIDKLEIKTYDEIFSFKKLEMDLDGDLKGDVYDVQSYKVTDGVSQDLAPPFPPSNLHYEMNANDSITLLWTAAADYDIKYYQVDRTVVKNGESTFKAKVYDSFAQKFVENSPIDGESVIYSITTYDLADNTSDAATLTIDLTEEEEVVEEEEEEVVTEEPVVDEPVEEIADDEVEELGRLINYYRVRYSIKCMPSGISVPENDSACLWARIDLVYSQELTGNELVADLTLSERDLELMTSRRRWPELRYQENCVDTSELASYCSSLGKALDRTAYFLD